MTATATEFDIETKKQMILEIIGDELCTEMCEVRHEPAANRRFAVTVVANGRYVVFSGYFLDRAAKRIGKEVDSNVNNIVVSVKPNRAVEFTVYVN